MRFDIISLFPELISSYFEESILKKAKDKKLIEIVQHQLRSYAKDKHRQVDDAPYGGGSGMLLKVDVLSSAVDSVSKMDKREPYVVYLSPQGKKLNNVKAKELSLKERLILVCGRYEGVDQRFIDICVDEEISVGDYVLSGGELAAAVLVDTVSRFVPGVVGDQESVLCDSLENDRMKYPQYTRPREYKGHKVPEVLLSGNHAEIDEWRYNQTKPPSIRDFDIYMCLLHHPVKNKNGEIISTAVTNLDIHDLARLNETFGLKKYYIITPINEQRELVKRVLDHWASSYGSGRNTYRSKAISGITVSPSLDKVVAEIESDTGKKVKVISTTAKKYDESISFDNFATKINHEHCYLIIFGTGWGIDDEILKKSDYILDRLSYDTGYNHLSVRSAVSITLDRLYGALGRLR